MVKVILTEIEDSSLVVLMVVVVVVVMVALLVVVGSFVVVAANGAEVGAETNSQQSLALHSGVVPEPEQATCKGSYTTLYVPGHG